MERIEGLVNEGRALSAAFRASYAFHDGKSLRAEYDAWEARVRRRPGTAPGALDEDTRHALERARATWRPKAPAEVS